MTSPADLQSLLETRIGREDPQLKTLLLHSSQIAVFGSTSVGLETVSSDLDVFCVGQTACGFKSRSLDVVWVSEDALGFPAWKQSELASHISCYGIWLKGTPEWIEGIQIGQPAIEKKRRRIQAFLTHLPKAWQDLEMCFKEKYSVKVRREVQRLLLLEQAVPVPPTVVLDRAWRDSQRARQAVFLKLEEASTGGHPLITFMSGLITGMNRAATGLPADEAALASLGQLQPQLGQAVAALIG